MGGGMVVCQKPRTMVLMGRSGNGKSATGNSILGREAFESEMSLSGVTSTVECQSTTLSNGEVLNVIDTPGLFDVRVEFEFISREIVKCIDLARDGIHAVLVVLSLKGRFTEEEADAIQSLCTFFGPKITDYMIVVFTGGDCLKKNMSLEKYLSRNCPEPLQRILKVCKNRSVLFDNNTEDEKKRASQVEKLLSLVDEVIEENDGQPYTDNLFAEFKESAIIQQLKEEAYVSEGHTTQELTQLAEQMKKSYDDHLNRMAEMVERRLREANDKLEQQLAEEKAARLNAEKIAQDARKQSEDQIQKLSEKLGLAVECAQNAQRQSEDEIRKLREKLAKAEMNVQDVHSNKCSIL